MRTSPLAPLQGLAHALARIVAGAMFSIHGAQKLFGVLTENPQPAVGSQLWFGGILELGCGAGVALGLFTPWLAFLASGTMAVAYVQFHWKGQLGLAALPLVNAGELAALYAVVFLLLATLGSGPFSVDALRGAGARRQDASRRSLL